ncbi:hypothetical protein KA005_38480, partial [bacterium]|nr:hypothetical protein [bacterium]
NNDNAKLRITAQGLRKLSVCAGIIWHPTGCRRTDNRSDRDYVSYQAVGGIKKADGAMVFWKGEYDLDFEVIKEELDDLHRNKCKNWNKSDDEKRAYIESSVRRDMIFRRKHKIKLAETGAANRVIRAILGLKSSYTKTELSNPFIMLRIVFQPDYSDPEVKRQMTAAAIQAMTGVYGEQIPQSEPIDIPPEDIKDVPSDKNDDKPGSDSPKKSEKQDSPHADMKKNNLTRTQYDDLGFEDQVSALQVMAATKGFSVPMPITEMNEDNRGRLFDHLESMQDAVDFKTNDNQTDDLPF